MKRVPVKKRRSVEPPADLRCSVCGKPLAAHWCQGPRWVGCQGALRRG
jgi:hypothetical protein